MIVAAVGLLRDARWLTADRGRAAAPILLAGMVFSAFSWMLAGVDFAGDFRSFWAASVLTLRGTPAAAYDPAIHRAIEAQVPGMLPGEWAAFLYPPIFLLICAPLALLPFAASAVIWGVGTWCLFVASVRPLIPWVAGAVCAVLAFPAAWVNAAAGQNGCLTAGLIGFGTLELDRRPILAGMCFGCLAYKPQFALAVPIALLASRRWCAAASAAGTALGLAAASVVAFGIAPWQGFLHEAHVIHAAVGGLEPAGKLLSGMGAAVFLGASPETAMAVQGMVSVAGYLALLWFARRSPAPLPLGGAICVCAAFASPWLHNYDLTLLALPVAWLVSEGAVSGFRPWEKTWALAAYLGPVLVVPLTMKTHLPVALLLLAAMGVAIVRRVVSDSAATIVSMPDWPGRPVVTSSAGPARLLRLTGNRT